MIDPMRHFTTLPRLIPRWNHGGRFRLIPRWKRLRVYLNFQAAKLVYPFQLAIRLEPRYILTRKYHADC
jgi:hypothetical protein